MIVVNDGSDIVYKQIFDNLEMHNNIEEYTKERFVAVLDIMGFKSMVEKNNDSDVYKIMRRIYDETSEVREYAKLNTIVFSDSIFIIFGKRIAPEINFRIRIKTPPMPYTYEPILTRY